MEIFQRRVPGYELAGSTSRGAKPQNEDRIRIVENGFVLVDGAGGMPDAGAYAEIVANRATKALSSGGSSAKALRDANDSAQVLGREVLHSRGGASACVCSLAQDGSVSISSAGDVKAFLINELGETSLLEPDVTGRDGKLMNYVGSERFLASFPLLIESDELRDATILAASDGVWKSISPYVMGQIVREESGGLSEIASSIIEEARGNLSVDDASVVLFRADKRQIIG